MKRIYTDLDSLFDTRVVILSALTNGGSLDIGLQPEDYIKRVRDNFGMVSEKLFNIYYSRRGKSVFHHAPATYLFDFLKDYVLDSIQIDTQKDKTIECILNTYPYNFTPEEDKLFLIIVGKLLPGVDLKLIHRPIHDIDIEWVGNNINLFVSYYAVEWLQGALDNYELYSTILLETMVMAPCLISGMLESKYFDKEAIKSTRAFFNTICKFEYMDIGTFCGNEKLLKTRASGA